ncbi:unnamed protein product [Caenorhabditis sp. 36 PRJEB53466]|nr:unnamed protein product [Caenorhabditis sp. 36 PRJEB53466]
MTHAFLRPGGKSRRVPPSDISTDAAPTSGCPGSAFTNVRNADCFSSPHEPAEWCDGVTRFCCSDASNGTSIQCPDGTMYPFVEQKCDNHNENLPMSGNC